MKRSVLLNNIMRALFMTALISGAGLWAKACVKPVSVVCIPCPSPCPSPNLTLTGPFFFTGPFFTGPICCTGCDSNVVVITQADIINSAPTGYLISAPGRYCFGEDLSYTPATGGSSTDPAAAIRITASNVELDFNNYTLTGPGAVPNVVGVKVASPGVTLFNVIVHNGTAQNFTLGLLVDPVVNLLLENMYFTRNGVLGSGFIMGGDQSIPNFPATPFSFVGGFAILGSGSPAPVPTALTTTQNEVIIRNVHATYNGGTTALAATYGGLIANSSNVWVEKSTFDFNTSVNSIAHGLRSNLFNQVTIIDSTANRNSGALQAVGFSFLGTVDDAFTQPALDAYLDRAIADYNFTTGAPASVIPYNVLLAAGFLFANVQSIFVQNSEGNGNFTPLAPAPFAQRASGFEIYASTDMKFENVLANNNRGASASYGFHINGARAKFHNAQSTMTVGPATPGAGFGVETYRNESAGPAADSININILNSFAANHSYGILLSNVINSVLEQNILENNLIDGIFVTQSANCLTRNNMIKFNQLLSNAVWGIEDVSGNTGSPGATGPSNSYIGNKAHDNGPGTGPGFTNYNTGVVLAGNAPASPEYIKYWAIPGTAPTGVTVLTNLDITDVNGCT